MKIQYRRDLWQLLKGCEGDAVEVGVAEGCFSADILAWPIQFPHLYMVDRWQCVPTQKGDASNSQEWHEANLAAARARVARFGDRAVFLRGDSVDMAKQILDGSLALVYIDGDHSYDGVMQDIVAWLPKLVPGGGVMAFHDYLSPQYGVKRAVDAFCQSQYLVHVIPEDKPEDAGAYFLC